MKTIKHLIAIALALLFFFGVVMALVDLGGTESSEGKKQSQVAVLPIVSVIKSNRISHHVTLTVHGEVQPLLRTKIKAKKRAKVRMISHQLAVGNRVTKDHTLITFDKANDKSKALEIQYQIAQAELLIMDEQEKAKLARRDWKLMGRRGSPSALLLRKGQLKAAFAQLAFVKAKLSEVLKTDNYETLTAPYDGIVVSRTVNQGELVNDGQVLAELISADELNINLKLDEQQWEMLGDNWKNQTVAVSSYIRLGETATNWTATIDRADGLVDRKTRMRSLYLSINSLEKPLAGNLVSVDIKGKKLTNLLKIPQAALTANGYIWFVDEQQQLDRFTSYVVFSEGDFIFVKVPVGSSQTQFNIVKTPFSSFIVGLNVATKQSEK